MLVAENTYKLVRMLPREELYGLSDQMRRSAVSIASNIAEGQERQSSSEFLKFISYAQGSRAELETQIMLTIRLGFLDFETAEETINLLGEIGRMLNTIKNKIVVK